MNEETKKEIEVGDVVMLPSGGLPMTVMHDNAGCPPGHVRCAWHDLEGCPRSVELPKAILRPLTGTSAEDVRAALAARGTTVHMHNSVDGDAFGRFFDLAQAKQRAMSGVGS